MTGWEAVAGKAISWVVGALVAILAAVAGYRKIRAGGETAAKLDREEEDADALRDAVGRAQRPYPDARRRDELYGVEDPPDAA